MPKILGKYIWIKMSFLISISLMTISWSSMSEGEKALAKFTSKFNQEISKDYGFFLFGSGASFPKKIEHIILSYQSKSYEDIAGARKLAVEIAHKMIDRMNQDDNLLKYLSSNPASLKHVSLTIGFKGSKQKTGALDSVMVIGSRNLLTFNIYNQNMTMLVTLKDEKFEEAEKIVGQERSSSCDSSP